jgi:hypothetical protein
MFSFRSSCRTHQPPTDATPNRLLSSASHRPGLPVGKDSLMGLEAKRSWGPSAIKSHRAKHFAAVMFAALLGQLITTAKPAIAQSLHPVIVYKSSNAPGVFNFSVTCGPVDGSGSETSTGSVTITPDKLGSPVRVALAGEVSNNNCVLTETHSNAGDWANPVIIGPTLSEDGIEFQVTNTKLSTLVVSKTSTGPTGSIGTFPITVSCPREQNGEVFTHTVTLTTAAQGVAVFSAPIVLPKGTFECNATEPELDTKWTFNPVTKSIVGGVENTISLINTRKTRQGFINKDFTIGHGLKLGTLASNSTFSFKVTCGTTADGNLQTFDPVIANPVFLDEIPEFDVSFGPVFAESTCAKTEEDPGPLWTPSTYVQEGNTIFVNERKTSSQTITKTLDSPAAGPLTFEFHLNDCTNATTAVNDTVSITIPQGSTEPVTSSEVWAPTGTTCTVDEVPVSGYLLPPAQTMNWVDSNGGIDVRNVREVLDVAVTKTASVASVLSGTPVTYTYNVKNIGNLDANLTRIVDDKCLIVSYVEGDTDSDQALDTTETWKYTCTQTLLQSHTTPGTNNVDNTVTLDARRSGDSDKDGPVITRTARARVVILQPAAATTTTPATTTTTTTPATTTTTTTPATTTTTTTPATTTAPAIALVFPALPAPVVSTIATIAPPTVSPSVSPTPTTTAVPVTIPALILAVSVPTTEPPKVEGIQVTEEPAYTGSSTNTLTLLALAALALGCAIVAFCRRLRKQQF